MILKASVSDVDIQSEQALWRKMLLQPNWCEEKISNTENLMVKEAARCEFLNQPSKIVVVCFTTAWLCQLSSSEVY